MQKYRAPVSCWLYDIFHNILENDPSGQKQNTHVCSFHFDTYAWHIYITTGPYANLTWTIRYNALMKSCKLKTERLQDCQIQIASVLHCLAPIPLHPTVDSVLCCAWLSCDLANRSKVLPLLSRTSRSQNKKLDVMNLTYWHRHS